MVAAGPGEPPKEGKVQQVPDVEGQTPPPPRTVAEAKQRPDWPLWEAALQDEMKAHEHHGTFKAVALPPGKKVTGSRFVFDYKNNAQGKITRYKVRWVVRGFSQVPGVDYDKTWAPVPSAATTRALMAVCAKKGWDMHHLDVKTAFLNATMDKELYVSSPVGYDVVDPGKVCLILRAMYGAKQAGRLWWILLHTHFTTAGATPSPADACLFV